MMTASQWTVMSTLEVEILRKSYLGLIVTKLVQIWTWVGVYVTDEGAV